MGKKMKLPSFISKNTESITPLLPWHSCQQPRTLSFRNTAENMFKTLNASYFDTSDSWFSNFSESGSLSTASEDDGAAASNSVETVIRGLRTSTALERLFFEPGETSSILEEAKGGAVAADAGFPFKESVEVLSMESRDPCLDFRKSMEEMVEAHGLKDWEGLEELLCWFLRVNEKHNHEYIVGAFVDLLVGFAFTAAAHSDDLSPSSPLSFCTSSSLSSFSTPCASSLEASSSLDV